MFKANVRVPLKQKRQPFSRQETCKPHLKLCQGYNGPYNARTVAGVTCTVNNYEL